MTAAVVSFPVERITARGLVAMLRPYVERAMEQSPRAEPIEVAYLALQLIDPGEDSPVVVREGCRAALENDRPRSAGGNAIMTGVGDQPRLRLISFKPIGKSGLAGFATVELGIGLRLFELPVFIGGQNGPWVALPRRPSLDRERRQRIGADGKLAFEPVAEWRDRETGDKFSAAVVDLVRAAHPDAFQDQAA